MQRVNTVIARDVKSWRDFCGGKEKIEVACLKIEAEQGANAVLKGLDAYPLTSR